MSQGDFHFFDDTAERILKGDYPNFPNSLEILLIDNTKLAAIDDTGTFIGDYTSARAADAPEQKSVIIGQGASSGWIPAGDLRKTLGVYAQESVDHLTVKYAIQRPSWIRIPGMNNVYQAILFDAVTEACFGFVDLTIDDGLTPFNLDWEPMWIQFGEESIGSYGLLFETELSEVGSLTTFNSVIKWLLQLHPFAPSSFGTRIYVSYGTPVPSRTRATGFKKPYNDTPPSKIIGSSLSRNGTVVKFDAGDLYWGTGGGSDLIEFFIMHIEYGESKATELVFDSLSWDLGVAPGTYAFDSRGVFTCEIVRP